MFAAAKAAAKKAAEKVKEEAKEAAKKAVEDAKKEALTAAKEAVEEAKDSAKDAVKGAVDEAKAKAEGAVKEGLDSAKAKAEGAVKEGLDSAKAKAEGIVEDAAGKVTNVATKNTTRKKNNNSTNTTRNTKSVKPTNTPKSEEAKPEIKEEVKDEIKEEVKDEVKEVKEEVKEEIKEEVKAEVKPTSSPTISSSELSLPFENFDRYNDIWKMCRETTTKFKTLAEQNKGSDLSVIEDTANAGKYILKSPTTNLLEGLTNLEVMKQLNLFRYRDLLITTKEKNFGNPKEFFNEVEANREYHSRVCIALCTMDTSAFKSEEMKTVKVSNLDILDQAAFKQNKTGKPFSPYELTFLVNSMMVLLAQWEIDAEWLGKTLYKDAYINAIISDENLASHLRLLSRYINQDKEAAFKKYPESLLMNYSYFYPFLLYPTGEEPK